jgi:hypothetical protein
MTDEDLWEKITEARSNKHPMSAPTVYNAPYGLVSDHEYSVLGAHELKNPDGSVHVKLIKMRNPWGTA